MENLDYVCIRTFSAGVHFGYLIYHKPLDGGFYEVELVNSRRMWSWAGANSLSELCQYGSKKHAVCNFSVPVNRIKLMAIEIIYVSDEAFQNLNKIPIWSFKD